ncbi:kinase [Fusarium phyllophilum]|uniref:Kinase n=1 Tax=Fusarium phyllophilum TaxID=47803 RepID=A0A8H5NDA6_9HYPO|nr:kinase [Fusarium phyllophilum]
MAPKLRYVRMDMDDLAWERNDSELEEWERSLNKATIYRDIANFILKHRPGKAVELHRPIKGGYNVFYRLEYEDGTSAAIRIPSPDEKVRYEAATMRYVAAHTTIPVPKIYHWGTAEENPLGLGPFMIMEYIEHETTLSHAFNDPTLSPTDSHSLDPNISIEKLQFLYRQMANILLQLSSLSFPRIGSLVEDEDGHISVSGRPLMQNMNSILDLTGSPSSLLPAKDRPFATSTEWYSTMTEMNLIQLMFQQNNAVEDEDDARDKYVARQLFRNLASEGRLEAKASKSGFRLFSEDLRPSNVLIDKELKVVGVIDWEFAYAAPAEFSFDPPWWLLLKYPEYWPGGYEKWMEAYEPRFKTFISVLQDEERKLQSNRNTEDSLKNLQVSENETFSLSQKMQESWESKEWMIRYLDPMFFGDNDEGDYRARLSSLSQQQQDALEPFVKFKMDQEMERKLVQWSEEDAERGLSPPHTATPLICSLRYPSAKPLLAGEYQHMEYFRVVCAGEFSLFLEVAEWEDIIIQGTLVEPALHHAALAIGALASRRYHPNVWQSNPAIVFSIRHYSMAIKDLQGRLDGSPRSVELAVLASVLFSYIEFLLDIDSRIEMHMQAAYSMLENILTRRDMALALFSRAGSNNEVGSSSTRHYLLAHAMHQITTQMTSLQHFASKMPVSK